MFTVVQLLILIVAVIGSGSMVAALAWLFYRSRNLEGREYGSLTDQVESLRAELETVSSEMARLQEQADFTERLLSKGPTSKSDERVIDPD